MLIMMIIQKKLATLLSDHSTHNSAYVSQYVTANDKQAYQNTTLLTAPICVFYVDFSFFSKTMLFISNICIAIFMMVKVNVPQ